MMPLSVWSCGGCEDRSLLISFTDDYSVFTAQVLLSNRLRGGSSHVEAHVLRRQKVDLGDLLQLPVTIMDSFWRLLGEHLLIKLYTVSCKRWLVQVFDR